MASTKGRTKRSRGRTVVHPNAAGVDIGSRINVAAVRSTGIEEPVRTFKTFTNDLQRLADWFEEAGVETVAMESTGVYWIPLFEILQERGLDVIVVNAREVKTVPGRKSDVNDAQWLQQLYQYGLLRASFRPTRGIAELRSYQWIYPVSVDSLGLSSPALRWATAGGRTVFSLSDR